MRAGNRGFTLVEVMITVAIIAILAAIATPVYHEQIRKSRRSDAIVALADTAHRMERCHAENNTFVYDAVNAAGCPQSYTTNDGYYSIAVVATQSTYSLTAQPTTKGGQDGDTRCFQLIMGSDGSKTSKNKAGTATEQCW